MLELNFDLSNRTNDYLYRAVRHIAESNEPIDLKITNKRYPREEFLSVINKFTNPVIITNITLYTLLEVVFCETDKKNTFKTDKDGTKTFEMYMDQFLNGSNTELIIFDEQSFACATIVRVNPLDLIE